MWYILCLVIGFVLGYIITNIYRNIKQKESLDKSFVGTLRFAKETPDSDPYLFVDLDKHPNEFMNDLLFAVMKVDRNVMSSQK